MSTEAFVVPSAVNPGTPLLSPADLLGMLERPDVVVIDISTAEQFAACHIRPVRAGQIVHGPVFWTYLLLEERGEVTDMEQTFGALFSQLGLTGEETLVFTEASPAEGFGQSYRGAFIARLLGWDPARLFVLNGGNVRWAYEQLPVETGPVIPQSTASPLQLTVQHALLADRREVTAIARGQRPGVVLLDCRDPDEWAETMPAPAGEDSDLPPGRIPGSISLNWDWFFGADETAAKIDDRMPAVFVARVKMHEIVRELQLHPHTPVVLYCYNGARASVVYTVLVDFLGFTDVRLYFPGWAEYTRNKTRVPFEPAAVLPSTSRSFGHNRAFVTAQFRHAGRLTGGASTSSGDAGYVEVDPAEIAELTRRHRWFVEPLLRASDHVRHTPFYHWLARIGSPLEFKPAALQLWGHSATFPQVMGAMLARTPLAQHRLMSHYAQHLHEEVEHHNWLEEWMLAQGLIASPLELTLFDRTPETNACVNIGWNMTVEGDAERWMCCLNSAIERLSNDLFRVLAVRMHELGAGHRYFDVHVGADQFHSIMGLRHVAPREAGTPEAVHLIRCALEGVKAWSDMLHSWINHPYRVQFNPDGYPIHPEPLLSANVEWNNLAEVVDHQPGWRANHPNHPHPSASKEVMTGSMAVAWLSRCRP